MTTSYFDIMDEYVKLLSTTGEDFLFQIGKFDSVRGVLVEGYREMCRLDWIQKIETLDEEEKRSLWVEAKRIAPCCHDVEVLKNICRALHALGTYIILKGSNRI